jgi:hypothetical protein
MMQADDVKYVENQKRDALSISTAYTEVCMAASTLRGRS